MSDRGAVHLYRPTFTKPDPNNPGKRLLLTSKNYAYRFEYQGQQYQKGGFAKAGEARTAGEKRKEEVRAGLEDDWQKLTVLGLYELAAARKVTWDDSTAKAFESCWSRIRRHFPDGSYVRHIDHAALLRLVGLLRGEQYAVNTIRLTLAHLRSAMNVAHRTRRLPWVPEFPPLKRERREQTIHTVELSQIVRLMPPCYHLFFDAAEEVGWRARSELRTRKWHHVDWGSQPGGLELDAKASKTDTSRVFPMTNRLREILIFARARVEEIQRTTGQVIPWVFCRDDGKPLADYRKAWSTACRRAGIRKLEGRSGPWSSSKVVHDIRRTAIRRWKKQGIDKDVRKAMAGHSTDEAHAMYEAIGADAETLRATALKLDQLREQEQPEKVVQLELFRSRG